MKMVKAVLGCLLLLSFTVLAADKAPSYPIAADGRALQTGVAQQNLGDAQLHAVLQQLRGVAVTQGVRHNGLRQPCGTGRGAEGAAHVLGRDGICAGTVGEQPARVSDSNGQVTFTVQGSTARAGAADSVKFCTLSDVHLYDTSLGTTGAAFEAELASDYKMLRESGAILDSAVTGILAENPKFVLVSGDMTKDGETSGHQLFVSKLQPLRNNGINVYVVPGNHDISNSHAVRFNADGTTTTPVDSPTSADFKTIYADFGYNQALVQDPNSLSYVVEPTPGLWVIAIDSCLPNTPVGQVAGQISAATESWILTQLANAYTQGKQVIAMMHHGILEHFTGQATYNVSFVVNDYQRLSHEFAAAGLHLMFTGHFHAVDAVVANWNETGSPYIYDVETGSTANYPCSYRVITLSGSQVSITSNRVTSIDSSVTAPLGGYPGTPDFPAWSAAYSQNAMTQMCSSVLAGASAAEIQQVTPLFAAAFDAHYKGDENLDAPTMAALNDMASSSDPGTKSLGQRLLSMATDLQPSDNSLTLDLYYPATLTSHIMAIPSTPKATQKVQFTAAAQGSTSLSYTWDFGDGLSATGSTVSHAYSVASTYTVKVTIVDATNSSVSDSTAIQVQAALTQHGTDSDADGFADAVETTMKSDPNDPTSRPNDMPMVAANAKLTLKGLSVKSYFDTQKTASDVLSVRGELPVASTFNPASAKVLVAVGVAGESFSLSSKGKATATPHQSLRLGKVNAKKGTATFSAQFKRFSFASQLTALGITPTGTLREAQLPVSVYVNDTVFETMAKVSFKVGRTTARGKLEK